ncbi:MAG: hypothetical protein ABIK28_00955 [Planctomycetota bacterium]
MMNYHLVTLLAVSVFISLLSSQSLSSSTKLEEVSWDAYNFEGDVKLNGKEGKWTGHRGHSGIAIQTS